MPNQWLTLPGAPFVNAIITKENVKALLPDGRICGIKGKVTIEVADATKLREPAGWERRGGRSAESVIQAWRAGGGGENILVTVCEALASQLRYLLALNKYALYKPVAAPTGFFRIGEGRIS